MTATVSFKVHNFTTADNTAIPHHDVIKSLVAAFD
jgi:hypothetical protein